MSAEQALEWRIVTRDQARSLADQPPAAIVTGAYPDAQPATGTGACDAGALARLSTDGRSWWIYGLEATLGKR